MAIVYNVFVIFAERLLFTILHNIFTILSSHLPCSTQHQWCMGGVQREHRQSLWGARANTIILLAEFFKLAPFVEPLPTVNLLYRCICCS